jgi:tetratricopeptide (TPR) repeat protein
VALSDVAAQAAPQDALIQFKRAYAAWRSLRHNSTLGEYYQVLNGVPEALAVVPYPRCYNFARLRFLVEFNNPQLISLGEGLLQTNPKDNDVKYKLVSIYGVALAYPSTNGNVKAHALKYATDLIQSEPNNSNDYSACASIYLSLWDRYHDKPDGDKAVAYYEQYLRLAPPDAEFRRMAQKFINEIQKDS